MKSPANFRLEAETLDLISQLANQQQTTRTDIVEHAIRAYARNKLEKKQRLMAFAGTLAEQEADNMLDVIQQTRNDKPEDFAVEPTYHLSE